MVGAMEAQPPDRHQTAAIKVPPSRRSEFHFEFIERPGNGIDDG
jgi:hypothetical protein